MRFDHVERVRLDEFEHYGLHRHHGHHGLHHGDVDIRHLGLVQRRHVLDG
jgi:hypothetical protein